MVQAGGRRGFLRLAGAAAAGLLVGLGVGSLAFPRREVVERPVEKVVEKEVPRPLAYGDDLAKKLWGDLGGRRHIVVIGAGPGGAALVKELVEHFRDREKPFAITVIERNMYWFSGPAHIEYIHGDTKLEEAVVETAAVETAGVVKVLHANALRVDPDNRVVYTDLGRVTYHYLVLSPGIENAEWLIRGLEGAVNLHVYTPSKVLAYADAVRRIERGTVLIGAPGPEPYKCPPGPYEQAIVTAALLRRLGRAEVRVVLLDPKPNPIPPVVSRTLAEAMRDLGVEYHPNTKIAEVYADRREVVTEAGERFRYDLLSINPPSTAPRFLWDSGLLRSVGRVAFVSVRHHDFRSEKYDDVYAIGDAANLPVSKAMYQVITLAQRLADVFANVFGMPVELRKPHNICWVYVSLDKAVPAIAEFEYEDGTLKSTAKTDAPSERYRETRLSWDKAALSRYWGKRF